MGRRVTLGLAVAVLVVAGLLPLAAMLFQSLESGGRFTLAAYRGVLASRREWVLLGHSLALALSTALAATVPGVPLGLLLARVRLPFRRLWVLLFTLPLLLPPYILAVAWGGLLPLRGLPGCTLVLSTAFLPVVLLSTMALACSVDSRQEEAARLAAGWPRTFARIVLPQMLPGILLSAGLVFLLALGEFGVPAFLRYDVFAVESYARFSAFYDFAAATASALPLAAIALLALAGERALARNRADSLEPAARRCALVGPGRSGPRLAIAVGLLAAGLVLLPLGSLLFQSLEPGAYREALERGGASLLRSVAYAAAGATALLLVGFPVGYLVHTRVFRFWKAVDSLTLLLLALPGAVLGIGLSGLWNHPAANWVYGTPAILVLGYVARYTLLAQRGTRAALARIPPSMEEAAQIAGAGWMRRTLWITLPLARRGVAATWLVSYLFCLRDMGVSMLVYPPGRDTLPIRIFTLMANGDPALVAALCCILVLAILPPLLAAALLFQPRRRTP